MDGYKVSVITPVFNSEDYIEETFESIKNQTFNYFVLLLFFYKKKLKIKGICYMPNFFIYNFYYVKPKIFISNIFFHYKI